jgi:hypothetical protein
MAEVQKDTIGSREDTLRFLGLVNLFQNWAMIGLGKIADPGTGKAQKNLAIAREFIDNLEMLQRKTQGNLSPDEAKVLQATLTDLRLMFVEESKAPAEPSKTEPPAEVQPPEADKAQAVDESKIKFHKKYE